MDKAKSILCIYAGGIAGLAAAFAAATVLGATLPVALGIGYTLTGGGIVAAACMDD